MFSAVFFDLDGTLIDSEMLWVDAVLAAAREGGCPLRPDEALALVYGRSWSDIFRDLQARAPATFPDYAVATAAMLRHYQAQRAQADIGIPSSLALLRDAAAAHPVAIVSGSASDDVRREVELLGLAPFLRFYLGCEDYAPGKPHPACYLLAAARLQVEPAACLVFEDSTHGIAAAKAAGMTCVALQRPGQPPQDHSAAQYRVADLADSRFLLA